jgi:cell division protein FtsB
MGHMKNNATINELRSEIKSMEADSANLEKKLRLYTDGNPEVIENVARENGLFKKNEDVYIINNE